MFVRSLVSLAALAAAVVAAPSALFARDSECSTGPINCCNSVSYANSTETANTLGVLGIVVQDASSLVGLQCTPIVGDSGCTQQPVCCNNNDYNGLVVIGCSPININA